MAEYDKGVITFDYEATPDEDGVIDGRKLALELMRDAFSLLVPYAKGCRRCVVSLFIGVGNHAIAGELAERPLLGRMCSTKGETEEERTANFNLHREKNKPDTLELLAEGEYTRELAEGRVN